jgi:hypothetical protein
MNEELMESPVLPNGGSGDSIIIPTPNKFTIDEDILKL